jgi:hypothetical protein
LQRVCGQTAAVHRVYPGRRKPLVAISANSLANVTSRSLNSQNKWDIMARQPVRADLAARPEDSMFKPHSHSAERIERLEMRIEELGEAIERSQRLMWREGYAPLSDQYCLFA